MKKLLVPTNVCAACSLPTIEPMGTLGAMVGFIGEAPDKWALARRRPISGINETALMVELSQIGLTLPNVRITNVWGHAQRAKGDETWEADYEANYKAAIQAVSKCAIVLLCGAGATKAFLSADGEKYMGLPTTSVRLRNKIVIPAPIMTAFAFKPIGELHFCLETLAKELRKL